jgi:hypothetical protein
MDGCGSLLEREAKAMAFLEGLTAPALATESIG